MAFTSVFIRRPVLSSMVSLGLVLIGVIGYTRLPVREFPDADPPVVTVTVLLPGASPQVIESAVTDVLEEELSSLEGLRTMTSASQEQIATITLEFNLDREIESSAQDVRDKVARVRGLLPEDIEEPVVAKEEADAFPIMFLALTSETYGLMELSDIADRQIKPRLQTISGVSGAPIYGERRFSMRVWLSPRELAARGLTAQDVEQAIRTRSVEIPAGRIESTRREFSVRYLGEMRTPEEFASLTVSSTGGPLVRLSDVARVEPGPEDERSVTRYAQQPAIFIGVVRQSKANVVEVAEHVHAELPAIQALLPQGVQLNMAFNGSVFVSRSIKEAQETLLITAGLVIVIIFVFLGSMRATIVPALAIPVSIVGTFALLAAAGYSINSLTLLGLILAIGIVVDDAIIVMENAFRHMEELKKDPQTAAIDGTAEITTAVIATTIALIAVFSPLLFLTGATGRLFNEFGVAVGGSVLISGIVALTLTPMLCARILRVSHGEGWFRRVVNRGLDAVTAFYGRTLGGVLGRPWFGIAGGALIAALAVLIFSRLEQEFVPAEDRSFFFIFVVAPEGSSVAYTDGYVKEVEAVLARTEGVRSSFAVVGFGGPPSSGFVGAILDDVEHREKDAQSIIGEVQPQFFFGIPGVFAFAANPPAFGGFGNPVQFVVKHRDFEQLVVAMDALTARAAQIPGLINVDTDLRVTKPELVIELDRDRAEDLGVSARDVATTLGTLLGGRDVARFTSDNKLYDVILRLDPSERSTPSDISGLEVRGRDGRLVPLDAVTRTEERLGPRQLNHHDRVKAFTLTASLAPGFTLGAALDSLNAAAAEVLPPGATIDYAGESREFRDSSSTLYFAFILAMVFVFMVLAAQYESLIHPFTVLLAVPLAITGALAALWLAGSTLNVYSQVGMILLIGLVSKNSILLVTYANGMRTAGRSAVEAMTEAGRIRLRPILMTSVATIFGALPIALGLGAGATSRRPLGYAIIGGMLVSTLLTLYLVPAVFVVFERLRERRRHRVYHSEPIHASVILVLLATLAWPTVMAAQQPAGVPVVTLPEARRRAELVNPLAVEARVTIASAEWERRAARADLLTPNLTASTSYTRYSEPFINFGTFTQTPVSTSAVLQASYSLLGTGKLAELRRAGASLASAEANETAARFAVALNTDAAYYRALADRELARAAEGRMQRATEALQVARARVVAGAAIATDSLQLLLEVNRARLDSVRRDSALAVSRLQLGRTIGLDAAAEPAPLDTLVRRLPIDETQLVTEYRERGPRLNQFRAAERSADAALGAQRSGYLPDVSLGASYNTFDAEFFPTARKLSQINITVSLPIWDAGRRELGVARARASRDIARAQRQDEERAAAQLMTEAWRGYETARASTELALVGVAVATENYRVQRRRYEEGATTILDLLAAQVDLTDAEATLVQSRHQARLALAAIEARLGRRLFE